MFADSFIVGVGMAEVYQFPVADPVPPRSSRAEAHSAVAFGASREAILLCPDD